MSGFRNLIIQHINKTTSIIPPRLLQKLTNQKLILPFYHAVSDEDCPHIKHLYSVKGVKNFIDDLEFLLKYYQPIDYKTFEEISLNKKQLNKPSFLLSFDDGLGEFHDVIAPILLKRGIPAICFLNSGFIDNKDLFFRYKASLLIDQLKQNPELSKQVSEYLNVRNPTEHILSIRYKVRQQLEDIADVINYSFDEFLLNQKPYLSSDQIISLIQQGFHFGAHSIDHPEYQHLDFDEQMQQTKESINDIVNRFSLNYKLFSFPFTDYNVSTKFFNELKSSGVADYTFGCAGQKQDSVSINYQRIPFELSDLSARKIHNSELIYYLLKLPFGKNIIRRK